MGEDRGVRRSRSDVMQGKRLPASIIMLKGGVVGRYNRNNEDVENAEWKSGRASFGSNQRDKIVRWCQPRGLEGAGDWCR